MQSGMSLQSLRLPGQLADHVQLTVTPGKRVALATADAQFKAQEPGTDDEVLQFCQLNYGVTFPIAKKVRLFFSFDHGKLLTGREM